MTKPTKKELLQIIKSLTEGGDAARAIEVLEIYKKLLSR